MYVESSAFQIHFLSEQEHWRTVSPASLQAAGAHSQPVSLPPSLKWCGVFSYWVVSLHTAEGSSLLISAYPSPGPVMWLVSFHSTPFLACGGKITICGGAGKQNWIAVKNLPLTNLLTFSKSLNFPQPCFFHLLIGDSPDVCVVWISYVSQSRDKSSWSGWEPYDSQYLQILLLMLIFFLRGRLTHSHSSVPVLTDSVGGKSKSACQWVEWPIWYICWKI